MDVDTGTGTRKEEVDRRTMHVDNIITSSDGNGNVCNTGRGIVVCSYERTSPTSIAVSQYGSQWGKFELRIIHRPWIIQRA